MRNEEEGEKKRQQRNHSNQFEYIFANFRSLCSTVWSFWSTSTLYFCFRLFIVYSVDMYVSLAVLFPFQLCWSRAVFLLLLKRFYCKHPPYISIIKITTARHSRTIHLITTSYNIFYICDSCVSYEVFFFRLVVAIMRCNCERNVCCCHLALTFVSHTIYWI